MITAQVENYADVLDELIVVYPAHWEELALNKDKITAGLAPMWDVYAQRDAAGQLLVVTLRQAGKLAGYFLGFVAPGLHYRNCLTYHMDIFYVTESARNAMGGRRMLRAVIEECQRRGVQRMFVGEKLHKPAGRLFASLGFEPVEMTHSLWIGA